MSNESTNPGPLPSPLPLSQTYSLPVGSSASSLQLQQQQQRNSRQQPLSSQPSTPTHNPPPRSSTLPFRRSRTLESDPGTSRRTTRRPKSSRIGTASSAVSTDGSTSRRSSATSYVHPNTLAAGRHRHMHRHATASSMGSAPQFGGDSDLGDIPDVFSPSRIKSLQTLASMNRSWTDQELMAEVERDMVRGGAASDPESDGADIALVRSATASPVVLPDVVPTDGSGVASPAAVSAYTPHYYSSESETESSVRSSLRRRADQVHVPVDEDVEIGSRQVDFSATGHGKNPGEDDNDDDDLNVAAELESLSDRNRLLRKHLTLKRELAGVSEWRKRMFLFLEAPSTLASKAYAGFHFVVVILSVVLVCIETAPQFYDQLPTWKPVDIAIGAYFTLDFLARLYSVPNRLKYLTRVLTILDIVTLVPYWIDAVGVTSTDNSLFVMRILRIGRVFQLFRHMRSSPLINITVQSVERSKEAFFLVVLYAALGILIASSAMHMLERGRWDPEKKVWIRTNPAGNAEEQSPFQSIPDGFYWAVVTITTTGYGDVLPSTNGGRFIAGFTMIIGVSIIALPVSIIGAHFMAEWIEYQRIRLKSKAQPLGTALDGQGNPLLGLAAAPTTLSKQAQIQQLLDRRDALMTLVQQSQDALNDIAPTETYARFLRMKDKYQVALARAHKLQLRKEELEEQVKDLKKLAGSTTLGGDEAASAGGVGALPFTRTMSRTTTWFRDWATGGEPYRNRAAAEQDRRPASAGGAGGLRGLFRHLSTHDVNDVQRSAPPQAIPLTSRTMSMPATSASRSPRRRPSRRILSNLFQKNTKRKPSPHSQFTSSSSSSASESGSESQSTDLVTAGLYHAHLPNRKISKSDIRRIDTAPILLGSNNSDVAGPSTAPAAASTSMAQSLPPWMVRDLPANPQLTVMSTMSAPIGLRVQFPDHEPVQQPRGFVDSPLEMSPMVSDAESALGGVDFGGGGGNGEGK
ncbi:hypothetical protein BCR44DRAFT_1103408 [Catenaria anguillulae PL171]|uniref:Ion transport domain-containing protein n=1 Tax=Catenaria anguillulae PL171 TaxID=765915 RepID=A0A1Y2I4M0_9FUNG|nr:hypothetical protein BCR44DRAFT_1103408 [Catenaria anguillulae PL171]